VEGAVLDHAQDLLLEGERHVADLVEEQRPPSHCSNFPAGAGRAPVKAPRSKPNSSLSSSVSGNAAQLTARNGRSPRPEASWIARATSSLPVPRSPTISTGRGMRATRATRLEHLADRARGADDAVALVGRLVQQPVLLAQRPVAVDQLDGGVELAQQGRHALVELVAAHEEVAGAGFHRLCGQPDIAAVGHRDHRELGVLGAERYERLAAVARTVAAQDSRAGRGRTVAARGSRRALRSSPTRRPPALSAGGLAQRADEVGEGSLRDASRTAMRFGHAQRSPRVRPRART
jgi:hypothetical protein